MVSRSGLLKLAACIVQGLVFVLILVAFFTPWYNYTLSGSSVVETLEGVQTTVGGITSSKTWADANQSSMRNFYTVLIVVLVFALFFGFILFILLSLVTFGGRLPLKLRLGLSFLKKKVKKIALILAILELICLTFATFFFMYHPNILAKDWQSTTGTNCGDPVCQNFNGSYFGPSLGWNVALTCFVLICIELLLLIFYALSIVKKMYYRRIGGSTSGRNTWFG